jgi:hypothetical protein
MNPPSKPQTAASHPMYDPFHLSRMYPEQWDLSEFASTKTNASEEGISSHPAYDPFYDLRSNSGLCDLL